MSEQPTEQRAKNGKFTEGNELGWKLGESGNPNGRPVSSVTTLLKKTDELTNQQIAEVIIKKVLEGEYSFVREYLDRTDGKVMDTHKIEGDIPITLIREPAKED